MKKGLWLMTGIGLCASAAFASDTVNLSCAADPEAPSPVSSADLHSACDAMLATLQDTRPGQDFRLGDDGNRAHIIFFVQTATPPRIGGRLAWRRGPDQAYQYGPLIYTVTMDKNTDKTSWKHLAKSLLAATPSPKSDTK